VIIRSGAAIPLGIAARPRLRDRGGTHEIAGPRRDRAVPGSAQVEDEIDERL